MSWVVVVFVLLLDTLCVLIAVREVARVRWGGFLERGLSYVP